MHNAGVVSLPQDSDWNTVVNLTGDSSWDARNMRRYLKAISKNEYLPAGNPAHGYDGLSAPSTKLSSPVLILSLFRLALVDL